MTEKIIDVEELMSTLNDPEYKRRELAKMKENREKRINEFTESQKGNEPIFGPADGSGNWQSFMREGESIHKLEKELAD